MLRVQQLVGVLGLVLDLEEWELEFDLEEWELEFDLEEWELEFDLEEWELEFDLEEWELEMLPWSPVVFALMYLFCRLSQL
jgi:hypothetical protein